MWMIILNDIANYMDTYFLRSVFVGLACAIILYLVLSLCRRSGKYDGSRARIVDKSIAFFFGIVYSYLVLGVTYLCREPVFEQVISFRPFSAPLGNPRLWAYFVENIIMFLPYGFILPILIGYFEKWYRCLFAGIISSAFIEAIQYMSARGKAQIDDVLLNTFGMMLGWVIFTVIAFIYRKKHKKEVD